MFKSIRTNKIKTALIFGSVFALLAVVIYFIAYYTGYGSIAIPLAVVVSFLGSFFSYYYSDKIVLKISAARPADEQTDKVIKNALEGVCIAAGAPMPRVYVIEDDAPNAFATGRSPKNAVVCVTTGLVCRLDYYQLEGVLAHEMAHIKNYDILISTVIAVMVGIVVILADIFTRSMFFGGRGGSRKRDNNQSGTAGLIIFIIGLVFIILAPIVGQLMKLAVSRNREYLADATAVEFTRNPDGLIGALEIIGKANMPVKTANNATAGLYIVNPLSSKTKQQKQNSLFSTHPPIDRRIAAIKNIM